MKLKPVMVASAIYLGLIGLGVMFVPRYFGIGAVPPNPPPALIAFLRIFGGPCLGIAVLNWMARNAEPSPARRAIVLANIVGFGCVTAVDVWGVFSGDARRIATAFLVVHFLFTLAFVVAARASMGRLWGGSREDL
ncbi:MAG TPA: hypothetical protein VHG35_00150 [Gemmatimonadales bacterium]|nr:hypothetical protein [Gemmatimonadales bacterium]